MRKEREAKTN